MRVTSQRARRALVLTVAAAAGAALIVGCGSSSTKPTNLSMSIAEKGKAASFQAPKTAKAGLVDVSFKNSGKAPHGVQFIQYTGNHTSQDVLKMLGSNSNKIPDWIRGQGGTATVPGGKSASATLNLPAGNYVVVDSAAVGGPSSGPPATAALKLSGGSTGDLPSTPATISADNPAKDKYKWSISGLKPGENNVTFNSKGKEADHLIIAVPVKGKAPPLSQIKKELAKQGNGPPPKWADFQNTQSSSILDGGSSQTLSFNLPKSGQYVFFCPLHDRDGKGKSHDQEGLLSVETVK
jgi:plastocyanin